MHADRAHHAHRLVSRSPFQERRQLSAAASAHVAARRNLKRKFLDIENAIPHSIKTFGLKVGQVSRGRFEARARELVAK
jgi:hypothetical protein